MCFHKLFNKYFPTERKLGTIHDLITNYFLETFRHENVSVSLLFIQVNPCIGCNFSFSKAKFQVIIAIFFVNFPVISLKEQRIFLAE